MLEARSQSGQLKVDPSGVMMRADKAKFLQEPEDDCRCVPYSDYQFGLMSKDPLHGTSCCLGETGPQFLQKRKGC